MGLVKAKSGGGSKVAIDMTPMIDVVFQLLIFFMLTLKIKADEGDFSINMPTQGTPQTQTEIPPPSVKVRLEANGDGSLKAMFFGRRKLGAGDRAYEALNMEVRKFIVKPGSPQAKESEIELDPDYGLNYQEIMKAIDAVTGKAQKDPSTGQLQIVKYVEKVKFAQPRKPGAK